MFPAAPSSAPHEPTLAERIRRLSDGRQRLDVAQFHFIGLNDIRDRYGAGWPAKRERVNLVARHFIAKRIAPEDLLIPGADGFLLIFGHRAGLIADAAAQRIAKALNDFFLGEGSADPDVRFEARRRTMSVEEITDAFGRMMVDALRAATRPPARPSLGDEPRPSADDSLRIGFQPVWDVRREAMTTYFVAPIDPRTGSRLPGYQFDAAPRSYVDLDERMLAASEAALLSLRDKGRKALAGVSVHISTLASEATLARVIGVMSGFDATLARYRVLRIAGVEPGFPRIYLEDIMRKLKTWAPNIALSLHWSEPDLKSVLALGPAIVGFSVPPSVVAQTALRSDLYARLASAVETAHASHTPLFVDAAVGPEAAMRLAASGVDNISSPLLWPVRAEIGAAESWPAARLNRMSAGSTAA
jgi:hypothetical protein